MPTINSINSNIPIEISKGGTNATSMVTTNGVTKFDGTRLVTSTTALIDASNRATNTSQPSFYAQLNSADNNVTGNGAIYRFGTNVALTVIFDQGSNMNTNGFFTAPVTGIYIFCAKLQLVGTTTASQIQLWIRTSARAFTNESQRPGSAMIFSANLSVVCRMVAGDTASVEVQTAGEASNSNDLLSTDGACFFSGSLLC